MGDRDYFTVRIERSAIVDDPVISHLFRSKGQTWHFATREEADRWVDDLNEDTRKDLRLRMAHAMDASDVDAYLIPHSPERR